MLVVTYPHGQGGVWLSNLMHSTISGCYNLTRPVLNYHDTELYPQSIQITTAHQTAADNTRAGSYSSLRSQYWAYCNGYEKLWRQTRQNISDLEHFFLLVNDARWRSSREFAQEYLHPMQLNADYITDQPEEFVANLYTILDQAKIDYQPSVDQALASIELFKQTCWGQRLLGNTDNLAWLAWCYSIDLGLGIKSLGDNAVDLAILKQYVQDNNHRFIRYTQENYTVL